MKTRKMQWVCHSEFHDHFVIFHHLTSNTKSLRKSNTKALCVISAYESKNKESWYLRVKVVLEATCLIFKE